VSFRARIDAQDDRMPEVIARAIAAQGKTTVDAVLQQLDDPPIPDDVDEVQAQGVRCCQCHSEVVLRDGRSLGEVTGWALLHRKDGGTHHVIRRHSTGRLLCGDCADRLRLGLTDDEQLEMT